MDVSDASKSRPSSSRATPTRFCKPNLTTPKSGAVKMPSCHSTPGRSGESNLPSSSKSITPKDSNASSSDIQVGDVVSHRDRLSAGDTNDIESEENSEIFLSIVWCGGRLGAAYYDVDSAIVHLLLDTLETDSFTLIKRLVDELHPSVIVTSAKQDERLILLLRKLTNNEEEGNAEERTDRDNQGRDRWFGDIETRLQNNRLREALNASGSTTNNDSSCLLEILPSLDFTYEANKHRIIMTELPGIPSHYTELERTLHMASRIPFDCTSAIRATGGLIKYLDKNRIGVGLEDAEVKTPILDLKTFTLKNVMFIDRSTYSALQIFKKVHHPAVFKMGSGAKEGLSLFGILNRTRSRPGRKLMQLWFNRPLCDKTALERRLDAVEYFVDPRNLETVKKLQDALKSTRNLSRILKQMRTATASISDWLGFYKTVVSVVSAADICRNASRLPGYDSLPAIFKEIARCHTQELVTVVKLIYHIMDKDESIAQNRFIVLTGIDTDLDEKKNLYAGLPSYLNKVAMAELEKFKNYIPKCHIMYMRRVGYLLALNQSEYVNGDKCNIPGLEFMLTSEATSYFKTERTRELDYELGDILEEIGDSETKIMHQLQNTILEHTPVLLDVCQYMSELDCLISFAIVAKELNYVRPTLTIGNIIEIKGGRHPLQECTVSLFVPNDVMMGNDHGRIKLLTGPNACGKSIYLKQAGLITYMAHIGSFVPAEKATIGLISKMYTRIRTIESVSTGMSTFAVDLNQMSTAVAGSNRNTLVLVDEFGKGTATVDGVSLLASCLIDWIERKQECPFVICSTHFQSLVKQNLLPNSEYVRYNTLDTLRDKQTDDLVFLYQLTDGVAGCSYAAHIALLAGLPKEIVIRGREVTKLIRENAPVRRYDITSTTSYMKRCHSLVEKFVTVNLENEPEVTEFMKTTVAKVMDTPKGSTRRRNMTSSYSVTSPASGDTSSETEDVVFPPKRACQITPPSGKSV